MDKNDIIKARASGHQAKLILKEISKDAVVEELKRQLAEKDKELEKLKNFKRDINNALYMDAYDERCGVDSIVLYTALKKDIRRILNEFDQIKGEKDG